ncbi:MAG: hypothetical protein R2757_01545 [Draconibacterium sp.]
MKKRTALIIFFIFLIMYSYSQISPNAQIETFYFAENENFPNNPKLPVLLYKRVFDFGNTDDPASVVEHTFQKSNWAGSWRNGIYTFHHYHSTAHEALSIYGGWAEVQLGGPNSKILRIEKGDLVVLPAGTAHKKIDSGDGFAVVGAYPDNQSWDMNYGKQGEMEKAKQNISKVKLPSQDPVFGTSGKMFDYWE